jgi:hypothetical protein
MGNSLGGHDGMLEAERKGREYTEKDTKTRSIDNAMGTYGWYGLGKRLGTRSKWTTNRKTD